MWGGAEGAEPWVRAQHGVRDTQARPLGSGCQEGLREMTRLSGARRSGTFQGFPRGRSLDGWSRRHAGSLVRDRGL